MQRTDRIANESPAEVDTRSNSRRTIRDLELFRKNVPLFYGKGDNRAIGSRDIRGIKGILLWEGADARTATTPGRHRDDAEATWDDTEPQSRVN
ncbi:unnamed protein product, partial [Iphiclides podalirius]